MKTVKLVDLDLGSLFEYGGIKWAVLDFSGGFALCISANVVCQRAFDDHNRNNFKGSTLRAWLNGEFIDNLVASGANRSAFIDIDIDLTSDDGLEDYGLDLVKVGLITCDMYREYRRYMPQVKGWWWTCTPQSTESGADGKYVRNVSASGALGNSYAFNGNVGVRPLCAIKGETLVHPSSD
ncbi:MAG: DUF6273 domain-containing protein [Clostridia bacterium]